MKIKHPENWQTRIKSAFLIFPKIGIQADGKKETRWLEMAEWREIYRDNQWCFYYWIN